MKKYTIPVSITASAGKMIGVVECNSLKEYKEAAYELWKSQDFDYPSTNISIDFEIDSDWDISDNLEEDDLIYYENV